MGRQLLFHEQERKLMRRVSTLNSSHTAENSEQIKALGLESDVSGTLPSFVSVVNNIRIGHPDGLEQLYNVFVMVSGSLRRSQKFTPT